jgi:hypothetical protein
VNINYCYVAGNSYSAPISVRLACGSCPLSYDDGVGVEEGNIVRNPSFEYSNGYINVRNYSGEVVIYRSDGSVYVKGIYRDGDKIGVERGIYIVKIKGATFKVVAR